MIMGAIEWLSQRLVSLRRPRPNLGALGLPHEIILMIAEHLTNVSGLSLSLTCRTLHSLCFPRQPDLSTEEKEELLLLLEKDIATFFFCHECVKLHRWHKRWADDLYYDIAKELPCTKGLGKHLYRPCIPYSHARLIMNRHLYGRAHGLPISQLEDRFSLCCPLSKVTECKDLQARIIDDKLLLLTIITLSHSQGDSEQLWRDMQYPLRYKICEHLVLSARYFAGLPVQLPELAKSQNTPGQFVLCEQSFGSCTVCATDYSIGISWHGKKKGYIIKVYGYRQLGECRSPDDWHWRTMISVVKVDELRTMYPVECRAGSVRDRWNKGDGIESSTESNWVPTPRLYSYSPSHRRTSANIAMGQ